MPLSWPVGAYAPISRPAALPLSETTVRSSATFAPLRAMGISPDMPAPSPRPEDTVGDQYLCMSHLFSFLNFLDTLYLLLGPLRYSILRCIHINRHDVWENRLLVGYVASMKRGEEEPR